MSALEKADTSELERDAQRVLTELSNAIGNEQWAYAVDRAWVLEGIAEQLRLRFEDS